MDLVAVVPEFNLYDQRWPIRTNVTQQPPAKFVFAQEGPAHGRRGGFRGQRRAASFPAAGCVHSVLSPGVRVNSYCEVEYSILMPGVEIGRYSRIRRAIINTGREDSRIERHRLRPGRRPRAAAITSPKAASS